MINGHHNFRIDSDKDVQREKNVFTALNASVALI